MLENEENIGLKNQILTSLGISTSAINPGELIQIYIVRLNPVLCFSITELPPFQIIFILVASLFSFA